MTRLAHRAETYTSLHSSTSNRTFLDDVIAGLRSTPKTLPCKYFYDDAGSKLFDRICDLDEYYLTRTELAILEAQAQSIAARIGPDAALIELGSGSSLKTRTLLDVLDRPAIYVPVDISGDYLIEASKTLAIDYPAIPIAPVVADFTQPFRLPERALTASRRVAFFPGSTIGNFEPSRVVALLKSIRKLVGQGGGLVVGVDLRKSREVLEPAYDDALGVTAAFNLNLLERINRELEGDFALDRFDHRARFNETEGRVEMHLVSRRRQVVSVAKGMHSFDFLEGESIHTESSYKYTLEQFGSLSKKAGFRTETVWTDDHKLFSVHALVVATQ